MQKELNRKKPFGSITPIWKGAFFEQDGYFFDAQGKVIPGLGNASGESSPEKSVVDPVAEVQDDASVQGEKEEVEVTIDQLLLNHENIQFFKFRKYAQQFLEEVPARKQDIINALSKRKKALENPGLGEVEDSNTEGVDLRAWGIGKKDYIFSDVREAIQKKYHRHVTGKLGALHALIDEGVVTDNEARSDIS